MSDQVTPTHAQMLTFICELRKSTWHIVHLDEPPTKPNIAREVTRIQWVANAGARNMSVCLVSNIVFLPNNAMVQEKTSFDISYEAVLTVLKDLRDLRARVRAGGDDEQHLHSNAIDASDGTKLVLSIPV